MPTAQCSQLFPDGGSNFKMENFVPAWYLLENHRGVECVAYCFVICFLCVNRLKDLRAGVANMRTETMAQSEAPRDLIKSHLDNFMNCVDALYSAQQTLSKAKKEHGWPLTTELEKLVRVLTLFSFYHAPVDNCIAQTSRCIIHWSLVKKGHCGFNQKRAECADTIYISLLPTTQY
jgi:hypothetical protein